MAQKLKKVLVTLADEKYLPMVKSLVNGAKQVGEWDGDFVTINNESEFWEPLKGNPSIHFYKIFLFHEYFKQWDWIFYCDLDIMFTGKIDLKLESRDPNFIYANDDDLTFGEQFETIPPSLRFREDKRAFQNCFNLFNSKMIDEDYFQKLVNDLELFEKYTHPLNKEQGIFNNVFYGKWKELGNEFVNRCPVLNEVDWDITKLKNGYYDENDYTDKTAVHFFQFFPPWDENNLRFYPLWKELMEDGFKVDMSDGQHKYDHPNGQTWQKYEIINGQPHGEWSHFFPNGKFSEQKFYFGGKKVGCWKTYHENGKQWSEDNYQDNKKEGISQKWRWDGVIEFSGHYKNDKKNGNWKYYYENGLVENAGNYEDGNRHGEWKRWLDSGELYNSKTYTDGRLDGEYTQYNLNGNVSMKGNYKDDKKHGKWFDYDENGNNTIEYNYKNGKLDGDKIHFYPNSDKPAKVETYENGLIFKVVIYKENSGEVLSEFNYLTHQKRMINYSEGSDIKQYEFNYVGDVKNGIYKRYSDDGLELVVGQYENNKKVGEWISKFDDGNLRKKQNYQDGYLHGEYEEYHPNGGKWKVCKYKNGSLDGLFLTYHSNGKLFSSVNYSESKIIGKYETFHPDGQKKSLSEYKNGRKNGLWEEWYINEQIKTSKVYDNNKLEGKFEEWFRNGVKRSEGEMKNHKMTGDWTFWYQNGNKQMESEFENGKAVGVVKIYHDNGKIKGEVEL
tara:strand:- start:1020 stop:3200 length:2181 start_codon:yes stop_codon:yes gene_type:complete